MMTTTETQSWELHQKMTTTETQSWDMREIDHEGNAVEGFFTLYEDWSWDIVIQGDSDTEFKQILHGYMSMWLLKDARETFKRAINNPSWVTPRPAGHIG